jgi:hypothetical protein
MKTQTYQEKRKSIVRSEWISQARFQLMSAYFSEFGGLPRVSIEHSLTLTGRKVRFLIRQEDIADFAKSVRAFNKYMGV